MRAFAAIVQRRFPGPPPVWWAGTALWVFGCSATVEPSAPAESVPSATDAAGASREVDPFLCDENARAEPDELKRLTMTQYKNTVRDLTRWVLDDPLEAEEVIGMAGLDALPIDRREPTPQDPSGSYRRLDQAVDQSHVDETFRVARALGSALSSPERLAAVVGPCATDADLENDERCLSSFVLDFGARVLRRPLDASDESFYRAVYGSDPSVDATAYADLITVMLSAPEFIYFVEHGEVEAADEPGTYELSAYELASRLSYHFWQTLPDDELWRAANDGSLLEPDVLARQVQRLISDDRARDTMAELFGDFLKLEELPALEAQVEDPVFKAFAGSDLPGPELRQQVIDEALDMLAYYTWTAPGGIEELFKSERSFAKGKDLARLYGVEPWDGSSPPPELPAGERGGLLSRAWFLVSGSVTTRPILRGVFMRRQLLCDELAAAPANVTAVFPAQKLDQTTRQAVEELTEQPGTTCAACHEAFINALGFTFEGFDALGRVRHEQRLFSDDGTEIGALPVDTSSVPRVTEGDETVANGPADVIEMMLKSGKLEACLARHYFRFAFGRYEEPSLDGCALERLRGRLAESGRIRDMLEEVALVPEFRTRRFEPTP